MRDYAVKPKESTPPLPDMPFRESQLEESLPAYGELSRPASLVDTKEKEASVTEFEAQEDAHDIDLGDRDDKAQDADAHHTAHAL